MVGLEETSKYLSYQLLLFSSFLRFIKGFIYRNHPRCPENEYFLDYIRFSFLMNLKRNLPKNVLDKSWPTPPPSLCEVSPAAQHTA